MKKILFLAFFFCLPFQCLADLYTASRAAIRVTVPGAIGSGIVVGSEGAFYYALTNAHVATAQRVKVEFFDAGKVTEFTAETVLRNEDADLAVLKIDTRGEYNPAIIPIDPAFSMKSGDVLATCGHPLGESPTLYFASYVGQDTTYGIKFTPAPKQGRSGSALLASDGSRVVGIIYAYTTDAAGRKIGLAIPARFIASFFGEALTGHKVKASWAVPKCDRLIKLNAESKSILVNKPEPEAEPEPLGPPAPETFSPGTGSYDPSAFWRERSPAGFFERLRQRQRTRPRFFMRPPMEGSPTPAPSGPDVDQSGYPGITDDSPIIGPIVPVQYQYPFQYEPMPGTCPGGTCPTSPKAKPAIPSTPTEKFPLEIAEPVGQDELSGSGKLLPDVDPAVVAKTVAGDIVKPLAKRLESVEADVKKLKEAPARAPADVITRLESVESGLRKVETEQAGFFDRKTIPDGVEEGLKKGLEESTRLALEDLKLEFGESTKAILTDAQASMKESAAAFEKTARAFQQSAEGVKANFDEINLFCKIVTISISLLSTAGTVLLAVKAWKVGMEGMKNG